MKVKVRDGKFDKALKIFKRNSVEIIQEVKSRQFYEKPSQSKRKAKAAGRIRVAQRKRKEEIEKNQF